MTEEELARYGQTFKDRAVARLLPPESAPLETVVRDVGVSADTLNCRHAQALAKLMTQRSGTAAARLEAIISTAALDKPAHGAWCREHGVLPHSLLHAFDRPSPPGQTSTFPRGFVDLP
jgi:hypothetical protein